MTSPGPHPVSLGASETSAACPPKLQRRQTISVSLNYGHPEIASVARLLRDDQSDKPPMSLRANGMSVAISEYEQTE